jgi:hypothetical protein
MSKRLIRADSDTAIDIFLTLRDENLVRTVDGGIAEYVDGYDDAKAALLVSERIGRVVTASSVAHIRKKRWGNLRRHELPRTPKATDPTVEAMRSELAALKALVSELSERIR